MTCQVSVAWSAFSCSPAAAAACSSDAAIVAAELVALGLVEPVVAAVALIAVAVDYAAVAALTVHPALAWVVSSQAAASFLA